MWRSNSIFFQITTLFLFAFISCLVFALFFTKIQPSIESIRQYNVIVNAIGKMRQFNVSLSEIRSFLEEESFHEVSARQEWLDKYAASIPSPTMSGLNINIIQDGNDIFIVLRTSQNIIVYQDSVSVKWSKYHIAIFICIMTLIIVYITLMRRLKPLNKIKNEIIEMARSNIFKKLVHGAKNRDEIGELVREFNRCVTKLDSLSQSRTLFLRSIMHELKTPITKGRISAEMLLDEKQKARLIDVFDRLNTLINEFAKIEELSSKNYCLKKVDILLTEVVNEAMRMLMIDPSNQNIITFIHNNDLIKADFNLFALIIKNLLDNAIKYSVDSKAVIEVKHHDLLIKNMGNPLTLDITQYFKPYFKNVKNPTSQGFGLGMYIVKTSLDAQNFELKYKYEDGYNIFIIKDCVIESFCDIESKSKYLKR